MSQGEETFSEMTATMAVEVALVSAEVALGGTDLDTADVHALDGDLLSGEALGAARLAEVAATEVLRALLDRDLLRDEDLATAAALEDDALGDGDLLRDALGVLAAGALVEPLAAEEVNFEGAALARVTLDLEEAALVAAALGDLAADDAALDDLDGLALDDAELAVGGAALDGHHFLKADLLDEPALGAAQSKGEDDTRAGLTPREGGSGRREKSERGRGGD